MSQFDKLKDALLLGGTRSALHCFPGTVDYEKVGCTVCACLNTIGGMIVLGVEDDGTVTGVGNAEEVRGRIGIILRENLSPSAYVAVSVENFENVSVVVIEVPAGRDQPYSFRRSFYLMGKTGIEQADGERLRDFLSRNHIAPTRWERRLSDAEIPDDINPDEIAAVVEDIRRIDESAFGKDESVAAVLEDLNFVKYGQLSNAGDVLFSDSVSFRSPQVRAIAYAYETDKTDNRFLDVQSFTGPLCVMIKKLIAFINRHTPRQIAFGDTLYRNQQSIYPYNLLREALVNALVHRDYSSASGGVRVHVYPRRLEIWNSGEFMEGVSSANIRRGNISVLRNPDIALVLFRRGYMEMAGRGGRLMDRLCRDNGLCPPEWISQKGENGGIKLIIAQKTSDGRLGLDGEINGEINGEIKNIVCEVIRQNPGVGRGFIIAEVGCSARKLDRILSLLVMDGKIEYRGSKRTGGYYVKEDVFEGKYKGLAAKGKRTSDGKFVLLKGSQVFHGETNTCIDAARKNRLKYSGVYLPDYVTKEDIVFDSPSSAACFVCGATVSGTVFWHL